MWLRQCVSELFGGGAFAQTVLAQSQQGRSRH
jgi:hypothetical protein